MIRKTLIAAAAITAAAIAAGGGYAVAATALPGQVGSISGCINTATRTVDNARGVPANLKSCPRGQVPFSVTSGQRGPAGPSGLEGAYYSVAKYDVGDTNGGAVATVACKSQADVAVSGGVQTLALGTNGLTGNVPVSSSFPGRMDWSTNTPVAGRLDGWIVQFGGNSSPVSLGDPAYVDVYALCVPGADIPVSTTYTESGS